MKTFIFKIIKGYERDNVRIYSAGAAFYIIVSSVPLIAILFYLLSLLSPSLSAELEAFIAGLLPKDIHGEFYNLMESIKENSFSALVPFSILAAVWGSTKGVGGLCHGIEAIYGTHKNTHFLLTAIKTIWRTLLFYGVIIGSLLLFAIGKLIYAQSLIVSILVRLRVVIFAVLLIFFFALFYARLANTKISAQLLGATFSAIGWMLFTFFYSIYVSYALNSVSIYAEMGTVILFMLWVYFCVNIILIGAQINKINNQNLL